KSLTETKQILVRPRVDEVREYARDGCCQSGLRNISQERQVSPAETEFPDHHRLGDASLNDDGSNRGRDHSAQAERLQTKIQGPDETSYYQDPGQQKQSAEFFVRPHDRVRDHDRERQQGDIHDENARTLLVLLRKERDDERLGSDQQKGVDRKVKERKLLHR